MSNPTKLYLRSIVSPYGNITRGTVLSHNDLDNNLIYLKGLSIYTATTSDGNVILTKYDGSQITFAGSGSGGTTSTLWSGGTGLGSVIMINDNYPNVASGTYSYAEGMKTTASGANSHAEGGGILNFVHAPIASGDYSHAEGLKTIAGGYATHAEGSYNTASGNSCHIENKDNITYADYSHVGGFANLLTSTAEGSTITAASGVTGTTPYTLYTNNINAKGFSLTDGLDTAFWNSSVESFIIQTDGGKGANLCQFGAQLTNTGNTVGVAGYGVFNQVQASGFFLTSPTYFDSYMAAKNIFNSTCDNIICTYPGDILMIPNIPIGTTTADDVIAKFSVSGSTFRNDIEVISGATANGGIILTDEVTGDRYRITMSGGTLVSTII